MKKTFHILIGWQGNCGLPDIVEVYRNREKAEHAYRARQQRVRQVRRSGRIYTRRGIERTRRRTCYTDLITKSCDIGDDERIAWVSICILHSRLEVDIRASRERAEAVLDRRINSYTNDQEELGVSMRDQDDLSLCRVVRVQFKEGVEEDTDDESIASTFRSRALSAYTLSASEASD